MPNQLLPECCPVKINYLTWIASNAIVSLTANGDDLQAGSRSTSSLRRAQEARVRKASLTNSALTQMDEAGVATWMAEALRGKPRKGAS
jgi:hypothetical protein